MTYTEAVAIILEELKQRLPANAKENFMPKPEVVVAMKLIEGKLKNDV